MDTEIAKPTIQNQRLVNLDIIRGVAVLGILLMNIQAFAMIFSAYSNPTSYGDLTGINYWVYYLCHLFADQKFMAIFSVLFGVGLALMADNIASTQGKSNAIHYKRMCFLGLFGLLHAYFLWFGDILFAYAVSGTLVFAARNKSIKYLLVLAFFLLIACSLIMLLIGMTIPHWQVEDLNEVKAIWSPTAELIAKEQTANLGSWLEQASQRYRMAIEMQQSIVFYMPRIMGLMLIGMALFKLDFFSAKYTSKTLILHGVFAVLAAVFIIVLGIDYNFAVNWGLEAMFIGIHYNYWGSLLMAYGYLCLLIVFSRANSAKWLNSAFANVGRMALTNYLMQSILCGFIFYGWGLGLFGSTDRWLQFIIVLAIWFWQLLFSTWWMDRFQFGPFEWLWRSMTYAKIQPFIKQQNSH